MSMIKWVGILLLSVLMGCNYGGSGGTPDTPEALRNAIPEHGGNPGPQAETTYVGRVDGIDALIAIVANEFAATGYLCDGAEVSEWFLGIPNGTGLHLDGEKGGSVDAEIAGDSVNGEVVHAGANRSFSTTTAVEDESGIYRSVGKEDGERIVSGWIFFDGELRGADEDSGKNVVGSVSISGIDDATGSGTGLAPSPAPVPFFDCNGEWCIHENLRCHIRGLTEEKNKTSDKKKIAQINSMLASAQKRLSESGNNLTENKCCCGVFACDSGYDNANDTICCDAAGCG